MEINDKEVIFLFLRKILITFDLVYFVCMHAYYSMQVEVRGHLTFESQFFPSTRWVSGIEYGPGLVVLRLYLLTIFLDQEIVYNFFSRQGLCRPDLP